MKQGTLIQLRSKVSRRILFTVFLCSLLPILALISLTIYNVNTHLSTDTALKLHHTGKNIGMAIMAELSSISGELKQLAALQEINPKNMQMITQPNNEALNPLLGSWFFSPNTEIATHTFNYTKEINQRLASGQPHLSIERDNTSLSLFIWVPVVDINGKECIAVGKINPKHLWVHALGFLPTNLRLTIVDEKFRSLLQPVEEMFIDPSSLQYADQTKRKYSEINIDGNTWLVGHWNLFLLAGFNSSTWKIFVGEPKDQSFASLFSFQKNAWLTSIATFWVILLASNILVRRTLHPLQKLKEATNEVGKGNYNFQLGIKSNDEFETLSDSFNQMVDKIQQQTTQQKNMGKGVREVLGSGGQIEIIQFFFKGLSRIVTIEMASLTIVNEDPKARASTWISFFSKDRNPKLLLDTKVVYQEIIPLLQTTELFTYGQSGDFPMLMKSFGATAFQHSLYFSVKISQGTWAIITLADPQLVPSEEELSNIRQLTDQLGIALSRAEMVKELDNLNIGIMTTLARTVDANSKWTHGHSERVTEYAIIIAKKLGLGEEECNDLYRAGLLHDLGKVSISPEILNKAGKLTAEEYSLIKEHSAEGDRILEPIQAFAKIRPFIRHHHERWDGKGYPDGLKGQEIQLGARILAVADVYDALYSDRPYRSGWSQNKVIKYLKEESGSAFDPDVVHALLRSLEDANTSAI